VKQHTNIGIRIEATRLARRYGYHIVHCFNARLGDSFLNSSKTLLPCKHMQKPVESNDLLDYQQNENLSIFEAPYKEKQKNK